MTGTRRVRVTSTRRVLVERVVAGGDGLARLDDGMVVFVEGALPGEEVDAEIVQLRRDHARARVAGVAVASPDRREPCCPHVASGCGGCGWAQVAEDRQGDLGQSVVLDALARIARVPDPPPLLPRWAVPADGYRTTLHLAVEADGRLAHHRRGGGSVVTDTCRVAHPAVEQLVPLVRAPGWERATLRVSVAEGSRLAVLAGPAPAGPAPDVPADVRVVLPGERGWLWEEVAGRRWRVSARAFFQSGPAAAGLLVAAVDDALGDAVGADGHLVDAYGGVGLLGGTAAARRGCRLTCVESHREAAADARRNLRDLGAGVAAVPVDRWTPMPADAVIADPARPGLGRPGVRAVAATGAARVILVSCDPASMARDVALLADAGYRLGSARVLGLFPDTPHVEVVSRFDRLASRFDR